MPRGEAFTGLDKLLRNNSSDFVLEIFVDEYYAKFLENAGVSKKNKNYEEDLRVLLQYSKLKVKKYVSDSNIKRVLIEFNEKIESDLVKYNPVEYGVAARMFNGFRYGVLGGSGLRFGVVDIFVAFKSIANNNLDLSPVVSRVIAGVFTVITSPVVIPLAGVSGMFGALRSIIEPKFNPKKAYDNIIDWMNIDESEKQEQPNSKSSMEIKKDDGKTKRNISRKETVLGDTTFFGFMGPDKKRFFSRLGKPTGSTERVNNDPKVALNNIAEIKLDENDDYKLVKQRVFKTVSGILSKNEKGVEKALEYLQKQKEEFAGVNPSDDTQKDYVESMSAFIDEMIKAVSKNQPNRRHTI